MCRARAIQTALLLVFAALALPSTAWAKQVALVVGIDRYDNLPESQQLRKAVNDSHTLGAALQGLGYQVVSADNADRRTFNEKWQNFLSLIQPGDSAAFFFAGHGIEIAGQNYLLPRDVPKPQSGEAALVKNESLSVTQLLVDLQAEGPAVSVVILDACRDNPFAESGVRSIGGMRGLARVDAPEGTFVMYSAGAGQTALDRLSDTDANTNSVFTRSLVPLINTPGLGMQEIALKVRENVVALADSVGHRQTPAYYDQLVGRFCPAGCEETTMPKSQPIENKAAAPLVPSPAPAPSQTLSTDAAAEAWAAAKETTSVSVLEAFITKYGDSFYSELARARLAEWKKQKEETKVTNIAPQEPPMTQPGEVFALVMPMSGAPGDGQVSLAVALKKRLSAGGVKLASAPARNVYTVKGSVVMAYAYGGKQNIRIDWQVLDPNGKELGTVSQQNTIARGALNGAWGPIADAAAGAAANGIIKLFPRDALTPSAADPQAVAAISPVAPQAAAASKYLVQIGSKQSQTEALATFADMQRRYPTLLAGYRPTATKVDLGAKGVWYRLRIGPIPDKDTATTLCTQLKSQGLPDCLVLAAQ
jgi:cell division septation protein DedD